MPTTAADIRHQEARAKVRAERTAAYESQIARQKAAKASIPKGASVDAGQTQYFYYDIDTGKVTVTPSQVGEGGKVVAQTVVVGQSGRYMTPREARLEERQRGIESAKPEIAAYQLTKGYVTQPSIAKGLMRQGPSVSTVIKPGQGSAVVGGMLGDLATRREGEYMGPVERPSYGLFFDVDTGAVMSSTGYAYGKNVPASVRETVAARSQAAGWKVADFGGEIYAGEIAAAPPGLLDLMLKRNGGQVSETPVYETRLYPKAGAALPSQGTTRLLPSAPEQVTELPRTAFHPVFEFSIMPQLRKDVERGVGMVEGGFASVLGKERAQAAIAPWKVAAEGGLLVTEFSQEMAKIVPGAVVLAKAGAEAGAMKLGIPIPKEERGRTLSELRAGAEYWTQAPYIIAPETAGLLSGRAALQRVTKIGISEIRIGGKTVLQDAFSGVGREETMQIMTRMAQDAERVTMKAAKGARFGPFSYEVAASKIGRGEKVAKAVARQFTAGPVEVAEISTRVRMRPRAGTLQIEESLYWGGVGAAQSVASDITEGRPIDIGKAGRMAVGGIVAYPLFKGAKLGIGEITAGFRKSGIGGKAPRPWEGVRKTVEMEKAKGGFREVRPARGAFTETGGGGFRLAERGKMRPEAGRGGRELEKAARKDLAEVRKGRYDIIRRATEGAIQGRKPFEPMRRREILPERRPPSEPMPVITGGKVTVISERRIIKEPERKPPEPYRKRAREDEKPKEEKPREDADFGLFLPGVPLPGVFGLPKFGGGWGEGGSKMGKSRIYGRLPDMLKLAARASRTRR